MKSKRVIMCCFLALMIGFTAANIQVPWGAFERLYSEEDYRFTDMRNSISDLMPQRFSMRESFLNFNSITERMLGQRVINGMLVLNNGMLSRRFFQDGHAPRLAQMFVSFEEMVSQAGIPFVYVQAPHKMDYEKTLLPAGQKDPCQEEADAVLSVLAENQVDAWDLRPQFGWTAEDIGQNFYVTDHHWTVPTAFQAYGYLVDKLQEKFCDQTDVSFYTDELNWETLEAEDPYLGSWGRYVGPYVAGVDRFEYLIPKFDTGITCIQGENINQGRFEEVLLRKSVLKNTEGLFAANQYAVYRGDGVPLLIYRNDGAPVNKKLLLIKDSYARPVQAFLSTVYTEVEAIDPRYYDEGLILEYAKETQPDIVLVMLTASTFPDVPELVFGCELAE